MTSREQAIERGRVNIALGRVLYEKDDPRHPDMDFGEAVGRRLLTAIGVPTEQHSELIAMQRERRQAERDFAEAIARNVEAVAHVVGQRMGLPKGLCFEYE